MMHQSERVTSTSGSVEEGEESDSESWPGDSTSPTDSEFFLAARVLKAVRTLRHDICQNSYPTGVFGAKILYKNA